MASAAGVFWLEADPASGLNRIHGLDHTGGGSFALLSESFGVRSQVNGYGGGALCAAPDRLFAVESASQQIHTVFPVGGQCEPLTRDSGACFGGLVWDPPRARLLAVREAADRQQLVAVREGQVEVLHQGEDFYSAPAVSASGRQLAWVSWSLPDMPWLASVLWLAEIGEDGRLARARPIPFPAASTAGSVQQPVFVGETLVVLSDHRGWWQPYNLSHPDRWQCLDETRLDGASAPWQLGESQHLRLASGWVRVKYRQGLGELWWQADGGAAAVRLADRYLDFRGLRQQGDRVVCIARAADRLDAVLAIHPQSGQVQCLAGGERPFGDTRLAVPEPFQLSADDEDGLSISGFFYAPVAASADRTGPPPLVMIAHGGPTSMVAPVLNPQVQFLCHQGFAVAEVNYRGSAGFGRDFRLCLGGQWGLLDVQDMEQAARYLVGGGQADAGRVFIQGRSSGGYTALMAMVSSAYFSAGVSQFGVSDPARLRTMTHRFESGYLDWLLGPLARNPGPWQQRSPLVQAGRIRRPMAFFQGGQDAVVVPDQTRAMAAAIRANGQQPLVREYPEEGHGFRKAANQADMLRRLADFYHHCC
ncbi:MAG TPA: prolyl oligopeptidase family serine peptidase [Desulfurivibrionaceae bacterium]|nr:prolyl oligopeptidase family serine peptidase [Desulfurivibrionaceae bacterium]